MAWEPPLKPAELTETRLIQAILEGVYPIDSPLPAERELAVQLGVTRPTLREALQRLAREGWLEIRQGKPTRVRNYWEEGSLGVLSVLVAHPQHLPESFVPSLLEIRSLLAPTYTRQAIERHAQRIQALLSTSASLPDEAQAFAEFDWQLHTALTTASANPVFALILNGFRQLYPLMARQYFTSPVAREVSLRFYQALDECCQEGDPVRAEVLCRGIMQRSQHLWLQEVERKLTGLTLEEQP